MSKAKIALLGVGHIGKTLALRLSKAGYDVSVANSGDPKTVAPENLANGARAGWTEEIVKGADVVILSVPLNKLPALRSVISSLPDATTVIDTSNYYPSRDGKIEAIENGQVESLWVQEKLGRPVAKAWNMILAESLAEKAHERGHPERITIAVAADRKRDFEVAAELVDACGCDAFNSGPIADSWKQQPGAPAYCTDLQLSEIKDALEKAERNRLPARRDLAIAVIGERLSDGKSALEPGYLARLNRILYM